MLLSTVEIDRVAAVPVAEVVVVVLEVVVDVEVEVVPPASSAATSFMK